MCSSFIWVTHFVNGAKILNATVVFASPPVAVIFAVTRVYASVQSQRLDLMTFSNSMLESFSFPSPYSVLFWSLMTYQSSALLVFCF